MYVRNCVNIKIIFELSQNIKLLSCSIYENSRNVNLMYSNAKGICVSWRTELHGGKVRRKRLQRI